MDNDDVAAIFYEIADILELQGVAFKPQAYRKAARSIEALEEDLAKVAREKRLKDLPGIGEAIAEKIEEILRTGGLSYLKTLRAQMPAGLLELLHVPDVGPKTAMLLHRELGVSSVSELKQAVLDHRLRGLKGFGEKSEERILHGIRTLESKGERTLLGEAYPVAEAYVEHLRSSQSLSRISVAGSLRRGKETVGDIDLLVGDDEPGRVMDAFVSYPEVSEVLMKGPTRSSVRLANGLQVDIRAVEVASYGAALQYFTGSKEHNVALRGIGVKTGLKLNEYGVFERGSDKRVAGATEEDVYAALGLPWIPPELRENNGEIDAAREGRLPELVDMEAVRGDFHVHTDWSDGVNSIDGMVEAAVGKGYDFIAITDHSQSLKITHGLTPDRLLEQVKAVRKAEERAGAKIRVLAGSEVDIKADGSLDFDKDVLKELDFVVGSVHSRFRMSKGEMTERLVAAVGSGWIDVLGHPTGRLIGERDPYEFDLETVLSAAERTEVCMEVNSYPNRLDLNDAHCRLAKEHGVRVAIGTDAHRADEMDFLRLGVITARRGWLGQKDVANTMRRDKVDAWLRRRRR